MAGWHVRPGPAATLAVWGDRPSARAAGLFPGCKVLRLEDAPLRGLRPGARVPPYGLIADPTGFHPDAARESLVERVLAAEPLDDPALLARAENGLARWRALGFGKYLAHDPDAVLPPEGAILIVDQIAGDTSVAASGAGRETFLSMLEAARTRWPDHPVAVCAHPAASARRPGHLTRSDLRPGEHWVAGAAPSAMLARVHRVLAVSSQLSLDAIFAGHRPVLFGTPAWAGWGLSEDPAPLPRRGRRLKRDQLFAGLMLRVPVWYDPFADRLCAFERILDFAEAEARAHGEDRQGYVATGMRLWKRAHVARMFGGQVRFSEPPARAARLARRLDRPLLAWGAAADRLASDELAAPGLIRVEDGLLRSRGLGARLVPPLSLIADPEGIHVDPSRPCRMDRLIAASPDLPEREIARARSLIDRIVAAGVTKYALAGAHPELPPGRRVLVVGQVADDLSMRLGAPGAVRDMRGLLAAARAAEPEAEILYKPHPDVEAGLRAGLRGCEAAGLSDIVLDGTDPAWAMERIDALWTVSSTMGFEALLRGVPVTCAGMPFYAGWGLTRDLTPAPPWRISGITPEGLAHAALIGAPRYADPATGRAMPVEAALERLVSGKVANHGPVLRLLAKAQGLRATLLPRRDRAGRLR